MTNPFVSMAAAALLGSGLLVRDGFVSEADREASLWLAGHEVHLSPAAREIVERRLRREGGPVFMGFDQARAEPRERYVPPPTKHRKFKHNRRG
jgi:hypothetical protein